MKQKSLRENILNRLLPIGAFIRKNAIMILAGLVAVSSVTALYFFYEYQDIRESSHQAGQGEVGKLVSLVSKLMVLPEGETPSVATVTDPEKLRDQAFFAKAKIGDKVLIYSQSGKVILYNPETNRIVEVAPINMDDGASSTQPGVQ